MTHIYDQWRLAFNEKKRELKICKIFKVSIKEQFEHFPQWFCCVESFTLGLSRGRFSQLKLFTGVLYFFFLFSTRCTANELICTAYRCYQILHIVWAQINVRTVLTFNESNLVIRLWPHLQFISFPSSSHNPHINGRKKVPKWTCLPFRSINF